MVMDEAAKRPGLAGHLLPQGKPPAEVAAVVGSPRQTVYRWLDVLNDCLEHHTHHALDDLGLEVQEFAEDQCIFSSGGASSDPAAVHTIYRQRLTTSKAPAATWPQTMFC